MNVKPLLFLYGTFAHSPNSDAIPLPTSDEFFDPAGDLEILYELLYRTQIAILRILAQASDLHLLFHFLSDCAHVGTSVRMIWTTILHSKEADADAYKENNRVIEWRFLEAN